MKTINRQKIALLFIIVFVSTILVKPIHLLFSDHPHSITQTHTDGKSASIHQDCYICLFMLHAFTPQQFAELEQRFDIYFTTFMQADIQMYAYRLSPPLSLRAPPVTVLS